MSSVPTQNQAPRYPRSRTFVRYNPSRYLVARRRVANGTAIAKEGSPPSASSALMGMAAHKRSAVALWSTGSSRGRRGKSSRPVPSCSRKSGPGPARVAPPECSSVTTPTPEACDDASSGMRLGEDQKTDEHERRGSQEGTSDQIRPHINLSLFLPIQPGIPMNEPQPC
jgi:hypothetical protein